MSDIHTWYYNGSAGTDRTDSLYYMGKEIRHAWYQGQLIWNKPSKMSGSVEFKFSKNYYADYYIPYTGTGDMVLIAGAGRALSEMKGRFNKIVLTTTVEADFIEAFDSIVPTFTANFKKYSGSYVSTTVFNPWCFGAKMRSHAISKDNHLKMTTSISYYLGTTLMYSYVLSISETTCPAGSYYNDSEWTTSTTRIVIIPWNYKYPDTAGNSKSGEFWVSVRASDKGYGYYSGEKHLGTLAEWPTPTLDNAEFNWS